MFRKSAFDLAPPSAFDAVPPEAPGKGWLDPLEAEALTARDRGTNANCQRKNIV